MINFLGQTDKGSPSQTQSYLLNTHRIYQNNALSEEASNISFVTIVISRNCLELQKIDKFNVFYTLTYSFKKLEGEISSKFDFKIILEKLDVNYIMYRIFCNK